jgi:gliding motility-associated-like protein
MRQSLRTILGFLVFFSARITILAQAPIADFSASSTSGCATLAVTFTDKSINNPRFWSWDFGNGQLSSLQNPTVYYGTPGVYTITLVVRNNSGVNSITKTNYIAVFASPQISFTADRQIICLPTTVQFTDNSTYTGGSIIGREWDFGDGTPLSNATNPNHTYTRTGFFNVSLKIITNNGCNASTSSYRFIRVVPGITTDFTNLPTNNCIAPFNVFFKNQSAGPGNITYNWNFGNGSTSNLKDPNTIYPSATSYTVNLSAQSDLGCTGTVQKVINLSKTITDFIVPSNACPNAAITFINNSSVTPIASTWYFSDGLQITQKDATRAFTTAGTYAVKLVNKYPDCIDSVTKNFTIITSPVISFTADQTTACKVPFTVTFTDNSAGANQWQWNFGDGILGSGSTVQHTYTQAGIFTVTLTLRTVNGCQGSNTKTGYIKIVAPTLQINNLPAGGCAPYPFTPQATITTNDPVQSYAWNFGDGGTSNAATPTHPYTTTGKFTLALSVTTTQGCTANISIPNAVKVGTPPTPNFTTTPPPPLTICASDSVQFLNNSSTADKFIWSFGDGDTSHQPNPKHKFSAGGALSVKLVAINNGCPDSTSKSIINVNAPVGKFTYNVKCASTGGIDVIFTNASFIDANPTTYQWLMGDPANTVKTGSGPINFTYATGGIYTVKLIVDNGVCKDTFTKKIDLLTEKASFTISNNKVCKNQPFVLTATNTNPSKVKTYQWKIGNVIAYANDTLNKLDTFITATGLYPVELTIIDTNGCKDIANIANYLTIAGPSTSFSAAKNGACLNSSLNFIDASNAAFSSIKKWTFDFGDNQSTSFSANPFIHTYNKTGVYNVRLITTDADGCADTLFKPFAVTITQPTANFGTAFTNYCPNKNIQFVDSSSGGINFTYAWNFGDGTTSNASNPLHPFAPSPTPYTIKLKITDAVGCDDSLTKPNYITIANPKASFSVQDTAAVCPPLETKFNYTGTPNANFYWVLGTGTDTLDGKNISYFYNNYGNFIAKLVVLGNGGCYDTALQNIYLYDPSKTVIINNPYTVACNEATINFDITTPVNTKFIFFFGDNAADSSQSKQLTHLYNYPAAYFPYVQLTDNFGCSVNVGAPNSIKVLGALPVFSISSKKFCDSGTVYLNNFTLSNDPPVSYLWNFKDGTTSTLFETSHQYNTPGFYAIDLQATTNSGCSKTFTDTVQVFRTPDITIKAPDTICVNNLIALQGILAKPDTAIHWQWTISDGRKATQQNFSIDFANAGAYTINLTAQNAFGCKDSASKAIDVKPLPQINLPSYASFNIKLDPGITIPATYSSGIASYFWTPNNYLSCNNCATPFANPTYATNYTVKVIDTNGCTNAQTIRIDVLCNNKNFFIPNTFSPNNDGNNDKFYPRGIGIERIASMRIFNRWGELIYEKKNFNANDIASGWDGAQKGKPAAIDTYMYMIDLICENSIIITYKGDITLIR